VFQDINVRKLAEKERESLMRQVDQRSSLLEAANKELEAFSYSVSHDLRAPLRHMSGFVDLLTRRYADAIPEKGKNYLATITDSVGQMGNLIDDLLTFSRTGQQNLHLTNADMNGILQEVVETMQQDNPERAINWIVGRLPAVRCDAAMLKLVWMNLLGNAVKFTQGRAKATIEIGARAEEGGDVFFVRDNGVGFDMQYAHKLFGVFQRLHSSEEFGGTGIGLANVRRIISRHGGRTWANAEIGNGATFSFSLPNNLEMTS
jgi:light-regulated signal transduction histidine kinase (bacteriophytochrome)